MNLFVLQKLILLPILILFILLFLFRFTKRNFRSIRLGAAFFLFAVSLLGYFYANQFGSISIYLQQWPQRLFIFIAVISGSVIILKIFDEIIFTKYLLEKADIRVPSLFRDIIIFTLLAVIILLTLRIEFGIKLTGILTSSAIISVIIGLALQDTLANIIAGIVLHIEKPFKIGDWIKTGEREGEVIEISWRATRIRTLDNNYIVIPNTNISKDIILNYYEPARAHAISFSIGLEYTAAPNKVKEVILKTIEDCRDILKNPAPIVYTANYGDYAIQYEIKIWIDDHSLHKKIQDEIMTKLWYSLRRNNIHIPFPIRTVYLQKEPKKTEVDPEMRKDIIKNTGLFQDVSDEDILQIARLSKIKHFANGERIIIQGEKGYSLYIIIQGQATVLGQSERGTLVPVKNLKEGEYFGEMSLLTGETRSATVIADNDILLIEVEANDILPIIKKNPNLMEILSRKLAERKIATKDILDKFLANEKLIEKEALSRNIFYRIKEFFSGK